MELHQGVLEGMVAEDAMQAYPEFFAEWAADPSSARVPGGELLSECRDRAVRALEERMAEHAAGDRIAVVSHQLVIAGLQCWILGEPLSRWRAHRVGNTAVVGIARGPSGVWSLVRPEMPGGPRPTSV
jgi:broad specificity phosphatase PhoE